MAVKRLEHVGIVVEDLSAAVAFFVELGLERQGEATVAGAWVDRIVGLDGVESEIVQLQTPDGLSRLELSRFRSPAYEGPARPIAPNQPGITHVLFAVDDIDDVLARLGSHGVELVGEVEQYEDRYRLCYVRGPAGVIVELAEELS